MNLPTYFYFYMHRTHRGLARQALVIMSKCKIYEIIIKCLYLTINFVDICKNVAALLSSRIA